MARLAHDEGNSVEARGLYNESLEIDRKLGNQIGVAISFGVLASLAELEGDRNEAARLYREALVIFERLNSPMADGARRDLERVGGAAPENISTQ